MPVGQADLDNAVREGWIRDEDNELSIDGYNSTIQITTNDGTSGFDIKNSTGAVSFSAKSDGDGYVAKNLGIGTFNPETQLEVIGKTRTDELQVTTGAQTGYILTSDADGNATWILPGSAAALILDGYVQDSTFQENKTAQEEINDSILQSLDGYAQDSTESEHYNQVSQAIQDIISVIDGYSTDDEFDGLTNTVAENNNQQQQINQSVLQSLDGYVVNSTFEENKNAQGEINNQILISLDGYASKVTEAEHYTQLSQAIQDITGVIDGYSTDVEFSGLTNTVEEHKNAQGEINNQILSSLDGYASKVTEAEHYSQLSQAVQDIVSVIDGYSTDTEFSGLANTVEENKNAQSQINQTIIKDLDGYETKVSAQSNYDAFGAAIITIRKDLEDGYADISGSAADGYIAFFTSPTSIAGDNDLYFDRISNQLQVSNFKLTTVPADGYVLTSDTDGNASWKLSPGAHHVHRALDQLVHNVAEDSFEEYTYSGAFVSNITIWNDSSKTIKIREEQYTYSGAFISQIVVIQYNGAGVETERVTEIYTYSGAFVSNITRTLT